MYKDKLEAYRKSGIIVSLFNIQSPTTLQWRMRVEYFNANGVRLPYGFGVHGNRTTLGTNYFQSSRDIHFVSSFLGHKSVKTTNCYIRPHILNMEERFRATTQLKFSPVIKEFDEALKSVYK